MTGYGSTRIAIIGAGDSGRRIWEALSATGVADVVACVDADPRRHGRELLTTTIQPPCWLAFNGWDLAAAPAGDPAAEEMATNARIEPGRLLTFPMTESDEALADRARRTLPDPMEHILSTASPRVSIRVGVFGTGSAAMKVWEALAEIDAAEIVWFADNDTSRQGGRLLWQDIIAPSKIPSSGFDFVVVGSMSRDPIRTQLQALGIRQEQILLPEVAGLVGSIHRELRSALLGTKGGTR